MISFRKNAPNLRPAIAAAIIAGCAFFAGAEPQAAETTVSVLYFSNTSDSAEYDWMRKGLADMVAGDLASLPGFALVEREELQRLVAEHELSLSGLLDESKAPEVGKMLSAELLVYGSYAIVGAELRMDAKAVRVETGAVVCAATAAGDAASALALERKLAADLAAGLGGNGARRPGAPAAGTESLAAASAYYRGLDLFDEGSYGAAAELFGIASREDPSYLKPGKGLEDAYRFLKDFKRQRWRREMNALSADIVDMAGRIRAPVFYSFGQAVMNPTAYGWKDAAEVSDFYRSRPMVLNGDTPVQAIFFLQTQLADLGNKAVEYFQDEALARRCGEEIMDWASEAARRWPSDPFLPETLYQRLIVLRSLGDWEAAKDACERLMGAYPDYRMMWAVEDMYETALEKLAR